MAMRRSTQMLLAGLGTFAIGTGVAFVTLAGSNDRAAAGPTTTTTAPPGTVVVPSGGAGVPSNFTIPPGKQALAVQVPFVAGLAGYAKPGDIVNVYGTFEKGPPPRPGVPPQNVHLSLANVEVLAVSGPGPGSGTASGAGAGTTTYLLALDAKQAATAIFASRFESLWMTLVPKGQAPAAPEMVTY